MFERGASILRGALVLLLSLLCCFQSRVEAAANPDREGAELLGKPAPELADLTWLNSPPLTMKSLRGHVVLIRFWLIDCPYCQATAPALNYIFDRYRAQGLVVIGVHHPKSAAARDLDLVARAAEELHFAFPIALDNNWTTVNSFWLAGKKRSYTSASFLIDKQGNIGWVHPGGEIKMEHGKTEGSDFDALETKILELLAKK